MKRILALTALFLVGFIAGAQTVPPHFTLSATIKDPNGHPFSKAFYQVQLIDSAGRAIPGTTRATYQGQPVSPTQYTGSLDTNGTFSVSVVPNNAVGFLPTTTQWQITISAPQATYLINKSQAWSISYATAITADTDLSTQLSAQAQPISYIDVTGPSAFLQPVYGITPTDPRQLATKAYVDATVGTGSAVQSGVQYQIPYYTTSLFPQVGPSNVTVDSTGNNLTVPGAVTIPGCSGKVVAADGTGCVSAGTGSVSGLTTAAIPLATGTTAIGKSSPLSVDDVNTPTKVMSTVPITSPGATVGPKITGVTGAVGNGTTDDTAAFAAAISAGSGGSLTILPPTSSYKLTTPLAIPSNTRIECLGNALIKQTGTGTNAKVFTITNASHVWVTGCALQGNGVSDYTNNSSNSANLIQISNATDVHIQKMHFSNFGYNAIWYTQANQLWIRDNVIVGLGQGCGAPGCSGNPGIPPFIQGNLLSGTGNGTSCTITVDQTTNPSGNTWQQGAPVTIASATPSGFNATTPLTSVSGNTLTYACSYTGAWSSGGTAVISPTSGNYNFGISGLGYGSGYHGVFIENNDISQTATGIEFADDHAAEVDGNYIHDMVSQHGIYGYPNSEGFTFNHNRFRNIPGDGIKCQKAFTNQDTGKCIEAKTNCENVGGACVIYGLASAITGTITGGSCGSGTCVLTITSGRTPVTQFFAIGGYAYVIGASPSGVNTDVTNAPIVSAVTPTTVSFPSSFTGAWSSGGTIYETWPIKDSSMDGGVVSNTSYGFDCDSYLDPLLACPNLTIQNVKVTGATNYGVRLDHSTGVVKGTHTQGVGGTCIYANAASGNRVTIRDSDLEDCGNQVQYSGGYGAGLVAVTAGLSLNPGLVDLWNNSVKPMLNSPSPSYALLANSTTIFSHGFNYYDTSANATVALAGGATNTPDPSTPAVLAYVAGSTTIASPTLCGNLCKVFINNSTPTTITVPVGGGQVDGTTMSFLIQDSVAGSTSISHSTMHTLNNKDYTSSATCGQQTFSAIYKGGVWIQNGAPVCTASTTAANCSSTTLANGLNVDGSLACRAVSSSDVTTGLGFTPASTTLADATPSVLCAQAADITINSKAITGGSSTASTTTVNVASTAGFWVGANVTVAGVSPGGFNVASAVITALVTSTSITYTSAANPGAWSSGGTVSLACDNQSTDAITATPQTFAGSITVPASFFATIGASITTQQEVGLYASSTAPTTSILKLLYGAQAIFVNATTFTNPASASDASGFWQWKTTALQPGVITASSLPWSMGSQSTSVGTTGNAVKNPFAASSYTSPQTMTVQAAFNPTGVVSGTYTSGITATGTVGQTCTLTSFNNSSTATGTVALTGTNTIAGGTALVITSRGQAATAAPTTATSGNGTATCSGTATIATVLGGAPGNAFVKLSLSVKQN